MKQKYDAVSAFLSVLYFPNWIHLAFWKFARVGSWFHGVNLPKQIELKTLRTEYVFIWASCCLL